MKKPFFSVNTNFGVISFKLQGGGSGERKKIGTKKKTPFSAISEEI